MIIYNEGLSFGSIINQLSLRSGTQITLILIYDKESFEDIGKNM